MTQIEQETIQLPQREPSSWGNQFKNEPDHDPDIFAPRVEEDEGPNEHALPQFEGDVPEEETVDASEVVVRPNEDDEPLETSEHQSEQTKETLVHSKADDLPRWARSKPGAQDPRARAYKD